MIRKHCLAYLTTWLLVLSLRRMVVADLTKFCSINSAPAPGGVCGSTLAIILSTVCKNNGGGFAGYYKRSMPDDVHAMVTQHQDESELFLPKTQAYSFLHGGSTLQKRSPVHQQGVVCECCYNRCSYGELSEYCTADGNVKPTVKKSAYKPIPVPYARVALAKLAHLQKSRADNLERSGDQENGVGQNNNKPTDVLAEDETLRESIYLRSLLNKERYPPSP